MKTLSTLFESCDSIREIIITSIATVMVASPLPKVSLVVQEPGHPRKSYTRNIGLWFLGVPRKYAFETPSQSV